MASNRIPSISGAVLLTLLVSACSNSRPAASSDSSRQRGNLRLLPRVGGARRQPPRHRPAPSLRSPRPSERQAFGGDGRPPGPPQSPDRRPAPRPHRLQRVPRRPQQPRPRHEPPGEPRRVRRPGAGARGLAHLRAAEPGLCGRLLPRQLRLQRGEGQGRLGGLGRRRRRLRRLPRPPAHGTSSAHRQRHARHLQPVPPLDGERGWQHQRRLRRPHQRPVRRVLQLHHLPRHGGPGRLPAGHRSRPRLCSPDRARRALPHTRWARTSRTSIRAPPARSAARSPAPSATSSPPRRSTPPVRRRARWSSGRSRPPRARPRSGPRRRPAAPPPTATATSRSTGWRGRTPRPSGPTVPSGAAPATGCRPAATRPSPAR